MQSLCSELVQDVSLRTAHYLRSSHLNSRKPVSDLDWLREESGHCEFEGCRILSTKIVDENYWSLLVSHQDLISMEACSSPKDVGGLWKDTVQGSTKLKVHLLPLSRDLWCLKHERNDGM